MIRHNRKYIRARVAPFSLSIYGIFVAVFLLFATEAFADEMNPWKSFGVIQTPAKNAVDFTLLDLEGKEVSLRSLRGKVAFVHFWATWCKACKTEMSSLDRLYQKYKDDSFVLLGIDMIESREKVQKFAKKLGVTFPILLDSEGIVGQNYSIMGLPSTYLIDKAGNLRGSVYGSKEWDNHEIEAILLELMRE